MTERLLEFLSYGFAQRALLAGALLAVLCSVVGVFLVLRRLSLLGEGLAHTSFTGIAVGLLAGVNPIYSALFFATAGSAFVLKIARGGRVHGDAATGIVLAIGMSCGVIISRLAGGFNVDLMNYLFGSVLTVSPAELWFSALAAVFVMALVALFFRELECICFDEEYARVCGINVRLADAALALATACVVVLAIRLAGILLVSALLIIPPSAALQFSKGFKATIFLSAVLSLCGALIGLLFSFVLDLPAGPSVVLAEAFIFIYALFYRRFSGGALAEKKL
ncbi:MAG TPA: metal ABC transporter permease [Elusimicrobiales bacterium]|nr:metal ABC transporter permease [Elusimicrobiales bacterium]